MQTDIYHLVRNRPSMSIIRPRECEAQNMAGYENSLLYQYLCAQQKLNCWIDNDVRYVRFIMLRISIYPP